MRCSILAVLPLILALSAAPARSQAIPTCMCTVTQNSFPKSDTFSTLSEQLVCSVPSQSCVVTGTVTWFQGPMTCCVAAGPWSGAGLSVADSHILDCLNNMTFWSCTGGAKALPAGSCVQPCFSGSPPLAVSATITDCFGAIYTTINPPPLGLVQFTASKNWSCP